MENNIKNIEKITGNNKISLNNGSLILEEKICNKQNSKILEIFDIEKNDNEKLELKNGNGGSIIKIFDKEFSVGFRGFEGKGEIDKKFFDKNSDLLISGGTCLFDDSCIKIESECGGGFSVLKKGYDKNFLLSGNFLKFKNFIFENNDKMTSYELDTILRFFVKTKKILEKIKPQLSEGKNVKINFELPVPSYLFYIYKLFEDGKISKNDYKKYFLEINKKKKFLKNKIDKIGDELGINVNVEISPIAEILEEIFNTKINFKFLGDFLNGDLKSVSDKELNEIQYGPYVKFLEKGIKDLGDNSLILQVDNLSETMIGQKFSSQNKAILKEKNISVGGIYSFPSVKNLKEYGGDLYLGGNIQKTKFQKLSTDEIFSFYEENFSDEIKKILQNN